MGCDRSIAPLPHPRPITIHNHANKQRENWWGAIALSHSPHIAVQVRDVRLAGCDRSIATPQEHVVCYIVFVLSIEIWLVHTRCVNAQLVKKRSRTRRTNRKLHQLARTHVPSPKPASPPPFLSSSLPLYSGVYPTLGIARCLFATFFFSFLPPLFAYFMEFTRRGWPRHVAGSSDTSGTNRWGFASLIARCRNNSSGPRSCHRILVMIAISPSARIDVNSSRVYSFSPGLSSNDIAGGTNLPSKVANLDVSTASEDCGWFRGRG